MALLSPKELAGVYERLKRADESIQNLQSEIAAFLKPPESGFSKNKVEAANQFSAHARRAVPTRFAVLVGEICQHLRSSLDYIAWELSSESYRRSDDTAIGFPVFLTKPSTKDEVKSYKRKIKGITSPAALKLIEQLQPYNAVNPARDPFALVHEVNRIEKHRALLLVTAPFRMQITLPTTLTQRAIGLYEAEYDVAALGTNEQVKIEFSQYVAVAEIAEWKDQAIIPLLSQLSNAIRKDIALFGA